MCALKPPFRANDMNGLYKRVLKGAYPPIDRSYSSDLVKVLATMLRVDPDLRPTCQQILEMESVRRKCNELRITLDDEHPRSSAMVSDNRTDIMLVDDLHGEALLKTIKVPANLANLSSRLPKSNYQRTRAEDITLSSIK